MKKGLLLSLITLFFCGLNTFAQSISVNIDEKKQQFHGTGGTTDSYMYVWSDHLSEEKVDQAAQMVAKDINLKFIKNYINGTPEVFPKTYTRFAKIVNAVRVYNPDIKVQISIQDLPDELEETEIKDGVTRAKKGHYDSTIPQIFDKIAEYYLAVIKGFHAEGVQVDQLDLLNEPGGVDYAVYFGKLYSEAIPRLKKLMADSEKNPDNLPMPEVLGTSQWSVGGTTKWFERWKKELPGAYEQVDVVTTHGYRMGWIEEEYQKIYDYIDGKPFQNNEQTAKLQKGDGLFETFGEDDPDYIGDVSMALRISDAVNGGVNHFFIFNLNNSSGNNASLIKTTKKGVVKKSKVYDGFRQLTSLQPDGSFCLGREMYSMNKNRVLCYRKGSENEVYVNITNITAEASTISLDMRNIEKEFRGIKSVKAWVSDETKDIEETLNQNYDKTVAHINYEAGPYSVNTLKITFTETAPEVMGKRAQTIQFSAIDDQPIENGSVELTASATSGLDVVFEVVSGSAKIEGNTLKFSKVGEVKVKAKQAGNSDFYSEAAVQSFSVIGAVEENLAKNKTVQSSSVFKDYSANKAVDGDNADKTSRWISAKNTDPHWLEVDLGDFFSVNKVVITSDESAVPKDFELQYWDGTEWKALFAETGNTSVKFQKEFTATNTSKVRLYSTSSSATEGWIKIFEVELYGEEKATSVSYLNKLSFSVYPNPTCDVLNIEGARKGETINVFSIDGVLQKSITGQKQIDVSYLKSGIYSISIRGYKSVVFIKK